MKVKMTVLALVMAITPQTRSAINRAFRADDFEIVWAATPSEAVEAATRNPAGLLLLDLDQPIHKARSILENLRTLHPSAPMVVLADPSSVHYEAIPGGLVAVLHKPFGAAVLADAANALLKAFPNDNVVSRNTDPDIRNAITDSERFRQMLLDRYNAPFKLAPSFRHWES